jgi:hypothetical protein
MLEKPLPLIFSSHDFPKLLLLDLPSPTLPSLSSMRGREAKEAVY